VRSVAIGAGHACALLFDDTVRCWGRPQGPAASVAEACVLGNGTLGEETLGDAVGEMQRLRPTLQAANPATALVAGAYTTCARLLDGTVRCWGMGDQLALGDLANTAPAGCSASRAAVTVRRADGAALSGVVSLAMGASHGCARRQDGSVWCWGANDLGQAGAASGGSPVAGAARVDLGSGMVVQQLSAGMTAGHACAMTADGRIKCWGDNRRYQLLWPVAEAYPGRAAGSMGDRLPLLSLP